EGKGGRRGGGRLPPAAPRRAWLALGRSAPRRREPWRLRGVLDDESAVPPPATLSPRLRRACRRTCSRRGPRRVRGGTRPRRTQRRRRVPAHNNNGQMSNRAPEESSLPPCSSTTRGFSGMKVEANRGPPGFYLGAGRPGGVLAVGRRPPRE